MHSFTPNLRVRPNTLWGSAQCNILRPRQNGHHFADNTFKCIFLNEKVWIAIKISMKFVPKCPINSIPALIQIIAWRWQATSHCVNHWWFDYWHICASLGLNELNIQKNVIPLTYFQWIPHSRIITFFHFEQNFKPKWTIHSGTWLTYINLSFIE